MRIVLNTLILAIDLLQYASARLWELSQKPLCGQNLEEANKLQAAIARADGVAFDAGVRVCTNP
jgi:hypothetical protein